MRHARRRYALRVFVYSNSGAGGARYMARYVYSLETPNAKRKGQTSRVARTLVSNRTVLYALQTAIESGYTPNDGSAS